MSRSNTPPPAPPPAPPRTLLTVKQMAAQHPGLAEGGIRWDLFNRDRNGLAESGAVIYRGSHILLDPDRYLSWNAGPKPRFTPRRGRRAAA